MNHISRNILLGAVALTLGLGTTGCHIYSKYQTPTDTELTRQYAEALQAAPDSTALGNLRWQQVFTDPTLAALIDTALVRNTDLRNAQLNVEAAQAQLLGAKLSYLPSVALQPNGAGAKYGSSGFNWSYQLPMAVSWEVDIFGKTLNAKRGAGASLEMTRDYEQACRSQIIAAVASTYYAIAAVKEQLALAKTTAQLWAESVQTMRDLKEAGRLTEAAVVQSTANYYSVQASIPDLQTQLVDLDNTMSLLLNVMPTAYSDGVKAATYIEIPAIAREGVLMRELAARPDVRAAEQSLAVAYYATNSARARFYPGLTISSNGGFTNLLGSFVKNPGDWFVQLAGSLTAPLFARGQNIAGLRAAKAQQQQAMNTFEHTLLNAAAEVSNALTVYDNNTAKSLLLDEQVTCLEKAVEYNQELLKYDGRSTYLDVLTAQQQLLQAQIGRINCSLTQSRAIINLYQSLGGGR